MTHKANDQAYGKGSVVRALVGGQQTDVRITDILANLDPPRFEADRVILAKDADDYRYPEEGHHVWGYVSDILEVIKF